MSTKLQLRSLCVGHLQSLDLKPLQVQIRSETPLEKIHVSFPRRCQLGTASALGMGAPVHFVLSTSASPGTWTCSGPVCVLTVSVHSFLHQPVVLGTYGCLGVIHPSGRNNLSTSAELPEPWEEGLMNTSSLGLNVLKSFSVYTLSSCDFFKLQLILFFRTKKKGSWHL